MLQSFQETGELKAPAQFEYLQQLLHYFPHSGAQVNPLISALDLCRMCPAFVLRAFCDNKHTGHELLVCDLC